MIEMIGSIALEMGASLNELAKLFWNSLKTLVRQLFRLQIRYAETMNQMYTIGVQSLPVMVFALTFVSLMFTIEFSFHMKMVLRQDSLVPAFSTVFMLREFGPVVTCFLLASRVGAAIAAEVGTMKISDQLESLKLLAIDPIEYLVIPRWIGCVFACVTITYVSVGIAILGGAFVASTKLGYPIGQYFNTMFLFAQFADFQQAFVKAVCFGTIIPFVAVHQGMRCRRGAQGVGEATTNAVVYAFLLIFATDFLITFLVS